MPLDYCCWGVGKGKKGSYNYDPAYIQFELCEDDLTDKIYYRQVFDVAVEYCAELCKTYGISAAHIVGHCEAYRQGYGSNHADPEHWMKNYGETMEDFRAAVDAVLGQAEEGSKIQGTAGWKGAYRVRVTAAALNIRKGPGTTMDKVGVIRDKGIYTIVEEKDGPGATKWGRLKSGAGWISLDYVKKELRH